MGWSWALYLCQDVLSEQMVRAEVARTGRDAEEIRSTQILRDRRPPPCPRPGYPLLCPYVDNANVMSTSAVEAKSCYDFLAKQLRSVGLVFKDDVIAQPELVCLGLRLDGKDLVITNKPERAWRQYLALEAVLSLSVVTGKLLEVVAGNLISFFTVERCLFSVMAEIWSLAVDLGDSSGPLTSAVRQELINARALTLFACHDMRRFPSEVVLCSDASGGGFALHAAVASVEEVRSAIQWKERWRFRPLEADERDEKSLPCGASACLEEAAPDFEEWISKDLGLCQKSSRRSRQNLRVEVEDERLVQPLAESLLDASRWSRLLVGGFRSEGAIHYKESYVAVRGLASVCRHVAFHDSILLSLGDNMGELLASEKGRANDRGLNASCRRVCAYQVGANVAWRRRHVVSEENPSDADSRLHEKGFVRPGEVLGPAAVRRRLEGVEKGGEGGRRTIAKAFLELFAGSAALTEGVLERGGLVAHPIDVRFGEEHDLTKPSVQKTILSWIYGRRVGFVWLGTPCTSFSIAKKGTSEHGKAHDSRSTVAFSCRVIEVCTSLGIPWAVENPKSSRLWKIPRAVKIFEKSRSLDVCFPLCSYGTSYQKWTRIRTTYAPLGDLASSCHCVIQHDRLHGMFRSYGSSSRKFEWKTTSASHYPPALSRRVASLLVDGGCVASAAGCEKPWAKRWLDDLLGQRRGRDCAEFVPVGLEAGWTSPWKYEDDFALDHGFSRKRWEDVVASGFDTRYGTNPEFCRACPRAPRCRPSGEEGSFPEGFPQDLVGDSPDGSCVQQGLARFPEVSRATEDAQLPVGGVEGLDTSRPSRHGRTDRDLLGPGVRGRLLAEPGSCEGVWRVVAHGSEDELLSSVPASVPWILKEAPRCIERRRHVGGSCVDDGLVLEAGRREVQSDGSCDPSRVRRLRAPRGDDQLGPSVLRRGGESVEVPFGRVGLPPRRAPEAGEEPAVRRHDPRRHELGPSTLVGAFGRPPGQVAAEREDLQVLDGGMGSSTSYSVGGSRPTDQAPRAASTKAWWCERRFDHGRPCGEDLCSRKVAQSELVPPLLETRPLLAPPRLGFGRAQEGGRLGGEKDREVLRLLRERGFWKNGFPEELSRPTHPPRRPSGSWGCGSEALSRQARGSLAVAKAFPLAVAERNTAPPYMSRCKS